MSRFVEHKINGGVSDYMLMCGGDYILMYGQAPLYPAFIDAAALEQIRNVLKVLHRRHSPR
jgi:hypothetical protein